MRRTQNGDKVFGQENLSNLEDSRSLPTLTAEESETYSHIMSDVKTRLDETIVRFITGEYSMDQWDSFTAELIGMGIPEAQAIQQAAYERLMAR